MSAVQPHPRELRRQPRHKVFQLAEMVAGAGAPVKVHLLNVSLGGVLAYGPDAPAIGSEVRFVSGVPGGCGRVAWRAGRRFGVAFTIPIGQHQIDAMLQAQQDQVRAAARRFGADGMLR